MVLSLELDSVRMDWMDHEKDIEKDNQNANRRDQLSRQATPKAPLLEN